MQTRYRNTKKLKRFFKPMKRYRRECIRSLVRILSGSVSLYIFFQRWKWVLESCSIRQVCVLLTYEPTSVVHYRIIIKKKIISNKMRRIKKNLKIIIGGETAKMMDVRHPPSGKKHGRVSGLLHT